MIHPGRTSLPPARAARSRARAGLLRALALTLAVLVGPPAQADGPAHARAADAGPARAGDPARARPSASISAAELERRHGIRVVMLGVTAAGGLVDLRLKVTDREKAQRLLADPANLPRLLPVRSERVLAPPHSATHGLSLRTDATSFLLYPNVGGAVRRGTRVAVAFGDVRIGPVVAR